MAGVTIDVYRDSSPAAQNNEQVRRRVTSGELVAGVLHLLLFFRTMKKKEKFFNFHVHIKAIFSIYIVEGTSL